MLKILSILLVCNTFFVHGCESKRDITVGIYAGGRTVSEYERLLDTKFDHVLLFQKIYDIDYSMVKQYMSRGYEVILNIEFFEERGNLKSIASGKYDRYLERLCDEAKAVGKVLWLRPLHEFNGSWYNWGVFYKGNKKEDFIPAWVHIYNFMKKRNAPVKFQLNYNRYNGYENRMPFYEIYPGDEFVDMVVITSYNRAYTDKYHMFWRSFESDFSDAYHQISNLTEKPIGIAEMSTTSYGGDKPLWIKEAFSSIKHDFPRVTQVTWFLLNKNTGNKIWDWDLNTIQDITAFRNGLEYLRK